MKIKVSELKKLIRESIREELQKEGLGDFFRSVTGRDQKYFQILSDLLAHPTQALAHEDFLLKNEKWMKNRASYDAGGPLNNAALYAVQAANKGVKGYGRGKSTEDVYNAVLAAYNLIER